MTRRKVFGILSIIWMVVIFVFSGRNGVQSTSDSTRTTMLLDSIVGDGTYVYDYTIDFMMRKAAHVGEYFVLSLLVTQVFIKNWNKIGKSCLISWLCVTIYSITDETHQLFVPGRSGQVRDVIVDSFGAVVGVMVTLIAVGLYRNAIRRRLNE